MERAQQAAAAAAEPSGSGADASSADLADAATAAAEKTTRRTYRPEHHNENSLQRDLSALEETYLATVKRLAVLCNSLSGTTTLEAVTAVRNDVYVRCGFYPWFCVPHAGARGVTKTGLVDNPPSTRKRAGATGAEFPDSLDNDVVKVDPGIDGDWDDRDHLDEQFMCIRKELQEVPRRARRTGRDRLHATPGRHLMAEPLVIAHRPLGRGHWCEVPVAAAGRQERRGRGHRPRRGPGLGDGPLREDRARPPVRRSALGRREHARDLRPAPGVSH